MGRAKKKLPTKNKGKDKYISLVLVKFIDTYKKDLEQEVKKINPKKNVNNVIATEILAQVILKDKEFFKKTKDVLNNYTKRRAKI